MYRPGILHADGGSTCLGDLILGLVVDFQYGIGFRKAKTSESRRTPINARKSNRENDKIASSNTNDRRKM